MARHNKILMESTSPDDPGAENSLKYIIHYISDSCQPLHTSGYDNLVLYANHLIKSIKTGENRVSSKSWTSNTPIDAVNDIGNSVVGNEYAAESYQLSCSVVWPKYKAHRKNNLGVGYYNDVIKTVDMQISKAGLRVARWINELARLNPQTAVEAATPPTAQPGTSNIEKNPPSPHESMPRSKKKRSKSSKKLASGAQKPDDPPPSSSDHDDHQVVGADTEWQVVTKKRTRP
ncbi:hypothetical protein BASA83_013467 [Batrachochytrium salamandrivorans]|nr:hypothetical protein BASA83_013467 [Batrachochytrium salamandrivorans]